MKNMFPPPLLVAIAFLFLTIGPIEADDVTYTSFGPGNQFTPLLNVPPDSGPTSFAATFTSAPVANAFFVNTNFEPNDLFSENYLFEPDGNAGNTLTVTLNMAVDSISLAFATNSFSGSNSLFFSSPSGDTSVAATPQPSAGGIGFDGGILTFSSATPFSTFNLMVNVGGPEFAIDDLNMHIAAVPETSASTLIAYGLAMLFLARLCRARRKPAA